MRILLGVVLALSFCLSGQSHAAVSELEQMRFKDASQYYVKGDYARAITVYKELINNGVHSANLYWNLSHVYWAIGSRADAMWAAYQAQEAAPRDMEVRSHLDFILKELNQSDSRIPELFFKENLLNHIASFLSEQELVLSILIASFLLGICLLAGTFFKSIRQWVFGCFTFWFILFTLFGSIAFSKFNLQRYPLAIISNKAASIRYGAGDQNSEAERLPVGARVRVLSTDAGWSHVAYKKNQTGWVLTDSIRKL